MEKTFIKKLTGKSFYNVKLTNLFYHCASIETTWWRRQERIDGCKNWIFRIFLCFLLSYYIFLDKIVWQLSFVVLNMIQYAFWLILWKYIFCHCQNSGLSLISVRCNIDPNIVYCIKKNVFVQNTTLLNCWSTGIYCQLYLIGLMIQYSIGF